MIPNPENFFKSYRERTDNTDIDRLNNFMFKTIYKHLLVGDVSRQEVDKIQYDRAIPRQEKLCALQEHIYAGTALRNMYYVLDKEDIFIIFKKGKNSKIVKTFVDQARIGVNVMFFRAPGLGTMVIHSLGLSEATTREASLVIQGDGCMLVIQSVKTFKQEYL